MCVCVSVLLRVCACLCVFVRACVLRRACVSARGREAYAAFNAAISVL